VGSAVKVLVEIPYSVLAARNGFIRNVVEWYKGQHVEGGKVIHLQRLREPSN